MTLQGEERYDILFPKYKKGGHIVRKVTVNPTYSKLSIISSLIFIPIYPMSFSFFTGYIDNLIRETTRHCKEGVVEVLPQDTPASLSSQYERPDKLSAIHSHKSRFSM